MHVRFRGLLSKAKYRWFQGPVVPIVADAAMATGTVGHGRLIPVLIVDTTDRSDLEELIRIHQYVGPGDVVSQWATLEDGTGRIGLSLEFKKPVKLSVLLAFDMPKRASVVDQIITTHGFYLQAGRLGDRFINKPDEPKLILEVPETGFRQIWDDMFFRSVTSDLRKRGLSRAEAKRVARQYIKQWREFGNFRAP